MAKKKTSILSGLLDLVNLSQEEVLTQRLVTGGESLTSLASSMYKSWFSMLSATPFQDRRVKYRDADSMDTYADICTALDLYATEATQPSQETGMIVDVSSPDAKVEEELQELFSRIRIESLAWGLTRAIAKYGDYFAYLIFDKDGGISDWQFCHPIKVNRVHDPLEAHKLIGYQYSSETTGYDTNYPVSEMPLTGAFERDNFDPWEWVHFSIQGSNLNSPYGQSLIEGARHTWKQLEMMETALAIYRLHRAGTQRVYYVDVGTAAADEAKQIVESWRRALKSRNYLQVESREGDMGEDQHQTSAFAEYLSKYNPLSLIDDIFWPVREGTTLNRVENLNSDVDVRAVADVDHFKQKLRVALGVPKAYLDGEIQGWNASKALAQQDMQFAKRVERVQTAVRDGLDRLCRIHLASSGMGEKAAEVEFEIVLQPASNLLEIQRLEVLTQRQNIANVMMNLTKTFGFDENLWSDYVLLHVMGFSKSFIRKYKKRIPIVQLPPPPKPVELGDPMDSVGLEAFTSTSTGAKSTATPTDIGLEEDYQIQRARARVRELRRSRGLPLPNSPGGFLVEDDEN
mgnify:CR=1 FL=1